MSQESPVVAITLGDPNGIGPEVVLKSLPILSDAVRPVLIGSLAVLRYHAQALGLADVVVESDTSLANSSARRPAIVDVGEGITEGLLGEVSQEGGWLSMQAVEQAVDMCVDGSVDAMVTAPISKEAVRLAGYNIPGHTEFIAKRTNASSYAMMMVAEQLRVGLISTHQPVREVADLVTKESILNRLSVIRRMLKADFGVQTPRIAVLGLNPHAGDGGMIGQEEVEVIAPAVKQFEGASGPFPADGFFGRRRYERFDAVLAMYHDQGLIPFKTLCANAGVNYTAGLPIVRTSPDHGTAFDIAGKGTASPDSMVRAIQLAIEVSQRRKNVR